MVKIQSVGHVNIIVDEIESATSFYCKLFNCEVLKTFPHFKNSGFAKSAGFIDNPQEVDVTMRILKIPGPELFIELFKYHNPQGKQSITYKKTNDLGGPRHICLRVKEIDQAFNHVKNLEGIQLINSSEKYMPFKIDEITPDQFYFHDPKLENDLVAKQEVCEIIGQIRYFYFIDHYGVQWEFEEGHEDIGH